MEIRNAVAPNLVEKDDVDKFEIDVYEADYEHEDPSGMPRWRKIRYDQPVIIEARSKKDLDALQRQYASCDQKFEIVRQVHAAKHVQQDAQTTNSQISKVDDINQDVTHTAGQIQKNVSSQEVQLQNENMQQIPKQKPRIVTIGDIQLKYDNDKVYQKQWVAISSQEGANIRVVNNNNNKIVNLDGKHIEVKRWVLVEQTSSEDNDDIDLT